MISVLSEFNPFQHWLNTPMGYYPHDRSYGNNLHILLFKNKTQIRLLLNDILDKIRFDLGDEVVELIDEIFILNTEDLDSKIIGIRFLNNKYAFGKVAK